MWLIIDDGSVDNTEEVVAGFKAENRVEIEYIRQENQGMHGAHNTAYANITTELNTCIDSDDLMPDNAVQFILEKWSAVTDKHLYAGLVGLDADLDGSLLGTAFITPTTTLENFYLRGGRGDKKLVYRTEVMQQYPPYPLFEGEKYVGLGYKYLLADQDYELITINEVLVWVDYQPGGSSMNMFRQYYNNPKGFAFIRKQGMVLSKSSKRRYIEAVHYVASSILSSNARFISESPKKVLTLLAIPPGILLWILITVKNRNISSSKEL